jgi:hypothetical protein
MTPEPPLSPPLWWECENECHKCREAHCPRRFIPDPADTIEERDEYEPKNQKER